MTDLEKLKITERDIEKLSGFEVNEVFIGSIFGGVYRPSIFRNSRQLLFLCFNKLFILILTFILTVPIGLLAIRSFPNAVTDIHVILQFLQVTLGTTLVVFIMCNIYSWLKVKQLKTLAQLLDEVDKYNEVLQTVALLDKLEAVRDIKDGLINRTEVIEALNVTRDTLTRGLMTEKTLRESRALLAHRYDLLTNIENNLATLKALEVNNQANEYGQLLNNALSISTNVHKEMQKLHRTSRPEL